MGKALTSVIGFVSAIALAVPAVAQPASGDEIVVTGEKKKKEIAQALKKLIEPTGREQLARFEDQVCPMVIGMPRDWTAAMTRMIRENITAIGGKLEPMGCKPNALAIFIDQPRELVAALHDAEPHLFNMTPREYAQFAALPGPVWSWHVTDMRDREGHQVAQGSMNGNDFAVIKNAAATRLYSNVREDMLGGFVVIDRQQTIGRTLRQLADLTTMHLMLDIKPGAEKQDMNSILSLFMPRAESNVVPARFSQFDRGILAGFYTQRENNRSATQQRENIAAAIRDGAGAERKAPERR
ncbi:hypothetical protein G7076_11180 [Sphingomonas sp. HDW15A]|uniref:hypothetical protein n=1 Tax=Sphingomonas sp. HDW15A TaxID=2714942 RepID=UPI0014078EAF|nr:hypothetical protein [Sphingomonas sp. HDW15A]QIK96909.1 hypothetical protein G7076_11180 [Sphingomonas sp. HDW15A]